MGEDDDIVEQVQNQGREGEERYREQQADSAGEGPAGDRSDPATGSTRPDPAAAETGPPPEGHDPMVGPAPSG